MKKVAILFVCLITGTLVSGQVAISSDNSDPDNSAMLDVKSTTKGMLPPRMTFSERNAIASPAEGLAVICTNCNVDGTACFSIFLAGQWLNMTGNCTLPASPAEGIHVQANAQIAWNWSAVPIATGYKWHTSNNIAAATDVGTATIFTEAGLTQGVNYTRYIWAYNACGNSEPTIITGQALSCGTSFSRTHIAGTVAPVTKTVTYGTATNIPGETSKCWITRNLGATQQPNSVSDNTEAAAGWYWQFNLKQGYKYASNRTPNTTWISIISENSDWTATNDPCSLLLGNTWRIPTDTEWINVDAAGNWTDWNGPFSSGLQMHAAGLLNVSDGVLYGRGSEGYCWSSVQSGDNYGQIVVFYNLGSYPDVGEKEYGFSIRCVRDN